jgi:general secretion pathway protein B
MSLILEALRKSEAERRRDNAPNVALELPPAPTRNPRSIPLWVWPLGLAMLGLLALVGWMGQRAGERNKAANTPHSTASVLRVDTPSAEPAPVAAPAPAQAIPPAPQLAPAPAPTSASVPVATNAAPASASMPTTSTAPAPLPPPRPAPAAPSAPQSPSTQPAPTQPAHAAPNLADTGLPAVKLSMHMWDAEPSKRFVILDGQRMGEGDRAGALSVITIERNGVLIERNGQRARIPLP